MLQKLSDEVRERHAHAKAARERRRLNQILRFGKAS
jgi:hypothetical protein